MKDYIQPFERELALRELQELACAVPEPLFNEHDRATEYSIIASTSQDILLKHLAFWNNVGAEFKRPTRQVQGEATSLIARNGAALADLPSVVPAIMNNKLPKKRCLRYATHGLHEYRGKFFPQLVRALINIAAVPENGIIMDPMCGSGTTLVESVLAGRLGYGSDMNPLSVFVTKVKCNSLAIDVHQLIRAFEQVSAGLIGQVVSTKSLGYFEALADADKKYLSAWFSQQTLGELDKIVSIVGRQREEAVRDFYMLALSNILRGVSLQREEDLRVRRTDRTLQEGEVVSRFIDEAGRSTKMLVAFLSSRPAADFGGFEVKEADARRAASVWPDLEGKVDAIITSPPYATALPYLDTDRLSLIYLGLLPRSDHRRRDQDMIGNREISERQRSDLWGSFEENCDLLPNATVALVNQIHGLNQNGSVGFRRRNLSALLGRYFFDMRAALQQQHSLLKRGGKAFMVVGNNRTTAGGVPVEINTVEHLIAIARTTGFEIQDNLSMEMLSSRDLFRNNATQSEHIITLTRN